MTLRSPSALSYFWRELDGALDTDDVPEGTLYWIEWGTGEDYLQYPLPLEEGTDAPTTE